MKIVTVNIPETYITAMNKLLGKGGIFPSRSELVRVAVREFLFKELKNAENMVKYTTPVEIEEFDDKNFVRIPVEKKDGNGESIREFKTYKIIKRLEY